MSKNLPTVS